MKVCPIQWQSGLCLFLHWYTGPSVYAHELRSGVSCPGSNSITCTDFGLVFNEEAVSNNNMLSGSNFEESEVTVYYHLQVFVLPYL